MTTKQESAYRFIKQRILDGYYGEGYRLIIDSIARELNCSVIPVRESIRRLEAEGLIEHIQNVGASVTRIDNEGYANALSTFALLEGFATATAAPHLNDHDFRKMEENIQEMEVMLKEGDLKRFEQLNHDFHSITYKKCTNNLILEFIETTRTKLSYMRKSIFPFIPHRGEKSIQEHKEILKLLINKSSFEQIEKYVREHKLNTLQSFIDFKNSPNTLMREGFR